MNLLEQTIKLNDSVLNSIKEINYWIKHKDSLKRRLLVEIRYNLYLIDTTTWSNISDEFLNYIIIQMQTDAMELAIQFSSKTMFFPLNKMVNISESDELPGHTYSIVLARIKILKVIANIPIELSTDNKAKLGLRLKNLKDLLLKLLNDLEKEK